VSVENIERSGTENILRATDVHAALSLPIWTVYAALGGPCLLRECFA